MKTKISRALKSTSTFSKTLALGLLLSLSTLTSCSTPEDETQQEDCTI